MGEVLGELMALFADGFVRRLRLARTRRQLAAGRSARIPCSARVDHPGEDAGYVNGRLLITPASATVTFASSALRLELTAGGEFHEPEPEVWHDQDWAATAYRPPGPGPLVYLQTDTAHLPLLHAALAAPAAAEPV
ncbi:hypothetical protein [Kitasatospora sp. NPDC057936]|uniref:hypothetical protein n=1 Tax=Kitasatospora sp. NPDC057936 TaxID=3346283 RepID=UPI0036DB8689